ncbi:MAG: hypothetical protein HZB51_21790 [Chloroflexi bacterium]|nr:hypothetical protein [Chloroflexota bacterium]
MERYARIVLLFASILFVLLVVCSGGALVAHNAMANSYPADAGFWVRQIEEEIQIVLARDTTSRAAVRMDLVAYRLNDLAARIGTPYEMEAFASLDDAVNRALVAIADLPADKRDAPLDQLGTWMYGAQDLLSEAGLARDQAFQAKLDEKISAVRDAGEKGMIAPDYLRAIATAIPVSKTPSAQASIPDILPRTVHAPRAFKHSYPLDGAHIKTACEKCHRNGVYAGTPRDCVACHRDVHVPTLGQQCATCHTTKAWTPATKK